MAKTTVQINTADKAERPKKPRPKFAKKVLEAEAKAFLEGRPDLQKIGVTTENILNNEAMVSTFIAILSGRKENKEIVQKAAQEKTVVRQTRALKKALEEEEKAVAEERRKLAPASDEEIKRIVSDEGKIIRPIQFNRGAGAKILAVLKDEDPAMIRTFAKNFEETTVDPRVLLSGFRKLLFGAIEAWRQFEQEGGVGNKRAYLKRILTRVSKEIMVKEFGVEDPADPQFHADDILYGKISFWAITAQFKSFFLIPSATEAVGVRRIQIPLTQAEQAKVQDLERQAAVARTKKVELKQAKEEMAVLLVALLIETVVGRSDLGPADLEGFEKIVARLMLDIKKIEQIKGVDLKKICGKAAIRKLHGIKAGDDVGRKTALLLAAAGGMTMEDLEVEVAAAKARSERKGKIISAASLAEGAMPPRVAQKKNEKGEDKKGRKRGKSRGNAEGKGTK